MQPARVRNSRRRLWPAGGAGEEDSAEEIWGLMADRMQLCAGTETPGCETKAMIRDAGEEYLEMLPLMLIVLCNASVWVCQYLLF